MAKRRRLFPRLPLPPEMLMTARLATRSSAAADVRIAHWPLLWRAPRRRPFGPAGSAAPAERTTSEQLETMTATPVPLSLLLSLSMPFRLSVPAWLHLPASA
jgi:hypothetical protein